MQRLLDIMRKLRDPESGCPWDIKQNFSSIAPYTIEEAYEVADAIERGDVAELQHELGDLLFQVAFHSQMAQEQELFAFADVLDSVCDKMERRHPHVFGDVRIGDAAAQTEAWERHKEAERKSHGAESLMDHVPRGMAELQRAVKLQKRAARVGFDWRSPEPVLDKLDEEIREMQEAMESGDIAHMEEELGDMLFAVTNLARQLHLDPARALRHASAKFERRFRVMEQITGDRDALDNMSLDDMEALWQRVKCEELERVGKNSHGRDQE